MEDRQQFLERLMRNYTPYYDIERFDTGEKPKPDIPIVAECVFDVHSEKYVLVKKAVLYEADSHEYLYLFSTPHLDMDTYTKCHDAAYEMGMKRVEPRRGHMYSYITALYLCDSCDADVIKKVKKTRIRKDFMFSFRGWMEFHTALVKFDDRSVCTNRAGRENAKFLKKLLQY